MSSINQEIQCDGPEGPLTTRTTVTIDFSVNWCTEDSLWSPPEGMPLAAAITLLLQGLTPRPGASSSSSHSSPSRSPSRGAMESPPCPPSTRSPSPLLCDVCLERWQLIVSPSDCDCDREAPTVSCHVFIYVYMLIIAVLIL